MPLTCVALSAQHLPAAAELVAARCRALQAAIPEIPARYTEAETILPLLSDLAQQSTGLVALRKGQLVGFLLAMVLPSFRGKRSVYSPEWANGALLAEADTIYQALYAQLAAQWVADGCILHALTVFANDTHGLAGWYWQGFGLNGIDAVRNMDDVRSEAAPFTIRRATLADLELVAAHSLALQEHLARPPVFKSLEEPDGPDYYVQWLAETDHVMWLACDDSGVPISSLGLVPANADTRLLMQDPGTLNIMHAYTEPDWRGHGVAAALLAQAISAGRAQGYVRCAVDFESPNITATRFWLRHFQPVCHSVIRVIR